MLQLKDYEGMAQQIGETFVTSPEDTTLNSLAMKVAESASLNPEGIRTVVRLANVVVFEKMFEKKSHDNSTDRRVNFELGDAEIVIAKLAEQAKVAYVTSAPATKDNYDVITDCNADLPRVFPEENIKEAAAPEVLETATLHPTLVTYKTKLAAGQLKADKEQAEVAWSNALEKAARCMMVDLSTVSERVEFEKNALASLGSGYHTELIAVNMLTSPNRKATNVFGGEKVASIIDTYVGRDNPKHKRAMEHLKIAHAARLRYEKLAEGLVRVNQHINGALV